MPTRMFGRSVFGPRFFGQSLVTALIATCAPATIGLFTSQSHAAIVTKQYSTFVSTGIGTTDPDGAFYADGTPVLVSLSFDDAAIYMGGADIYTRTTVTIPAGIQVNVGSDVFTADTYYIDIYNAGPFNTNPSVSFRTGAPPFDYFPVLHNGLPFAGGASGYMQFTFYGTGDGTPLPITPGVSVPIPPYFGEGLLRQVFSPHEYYFGQESFAEVPAPAAACLFASAAATLCMRRRTLRR